MQQQPQQPHEAVAGHTMEVPLGTLRVATATAADRKRRKSPIRNSSGGSSTSNSGSSISAQGPTPTALTVPVKGEGPFPAPSASSDMPAAAAAETQSAAAVGDGEGKDNPTGGESLRALQLLLSDVLGVLAMLRPAGSSALPRGVAAAVSRARHAAQAALKEKGRETDSSSPHKGGNTNVSIAAALAAAANTAAIVLEQRNPQFAFHQFTVLAAASLQQLAPYVTHHLRELLQVLEQRRSLLRLLRSQERRERHGSPQASDEGQTDNLRLLLQVFLAYCPAAMLDTVCDRLAAAYAQALLGETPPKQQETAAAAAAESAAATSAETVAAAAAPAPRSLARSQDDGVAVSVAALLGQRSFLQRLASSVNWGAIRSVPAAEEMESLPALGSSSGGTGTTTGAAPQIDDDPDVAAALRRAYSSAACLFDAEGPCAAEEGPPATESSPGTKPAAMGTSTKQEQRSIMPAPPQQPLDAPEDARQTTSSASLTGEQQQYQHPQKGALLDICPTGEESAAPAPAAAAKGPLDDTEAASFPPSEAPAAEPTEATTSSSQLLRALGSLELPPFLLQPSSYSRSASPAGGFRCSSEEAPTETARADAAATDASDYLRDGVAEGIVSEAGCTAAAGARTALCRPSWPMRQREESYGRGTLLQALSDVPEDYGVFPSRRKGGRAFTRDKSELTSAATAASVAPGPAAVPANVRYEGAEEKPAKGGNGGEAEEDTATRKATLVSFLLSLLPDSGSYAAGTGASDAAAPAAAPQEIATTDEATAAETTKALGCTQALLNSLQGHLLRYGPEESPAEHQQQHEALGAATGSRRNRNGGPPPTSRAGLYGKSEGYLPFGHIPSDMGREGGATAAALKTELLPLDDAAAAGMAPPLSDADPSRVKGRGGQPQQHCLALRQSGAAAASVTTEAGDFAGDSELLGAGSGSGSYSSLAEALGTPDEDFLGGGPGGVNAQLLYRSTISGVVYDKSGQKWTARWSEYGRQHKKTFATAKYGFLHAKKRAEACRLEASRLMREGQGRALAAAARLAQVGGALHTDGGRSGGGPSAFSGLAVSADAALALHGKDGPPEAEQQQQLVLQQDSDPNLHQQDSQQQLQQLQQREMEGAKRAVIEGPPQLLMEPQLGGPSAAPPPKRRRHKLFAADS